ncbi:MAG: acyl-CoA dehydrogenase family protein [Deltaproteobacteria bacterium]|nr:acyl-CoA dehydrogenase family protein [Deltaproteobacteria bacterium]MBI3295180.1 acyl-CoA dehydrogenase family protein [Deltaproteobacteria bacterium]
MIDFLRLEDTLTNSQRAIQQASRQIVAEEATPHIRQAYREELFPSHLPKALGAAGMLGPSIPIDGREVMGAVEYGLMMRELERCDSGLRSFASVQGALVMYPIYSFGSEEQKKTWLGPLSRGEKIGCFGLTESDGGSDPSAMKARATFKNGKWILKGSKCWITSGSIADVAVVWAQTEKGIRGFVVPTASKGFSAPRMEGKLSLRASVTSELYFDDIELPESAILAKSVGLKSALQCLNQARFSILWGVLGAAEACFDEALAFAKERILFGRSLSSFQLAQRKLALMATDITQGQLLALQIAHLKDSGKLHHSHISMGKQNNVAMALSVARTARDLLGANGITDEYCVMRHMINLESVFTYEGTNDIHLLIVGNELTGVPAFTNT